MDHQQIINALAGAEAELELSLQRCRKARILLEQVSAPAPSGDKKKAKLSQAEVIHITTGLRKNLLRGKAK